MYRFNEMNEIMEQATKENEIIINENDKLKERNFILECKVEELEEEIEELKEKVAICSTIGLAFMRKNKEKEPSLPTKDEFMEVLYTECVKNDIKPSKELEEWLANGRKLETN